MFLNPEHFKVVAGHDVVARVRAAHETIHDTGCGLDSEALCARQRSDAAAGLLGVEIVKSIYGHGVRYDSGLQNFGIVARSQELGGTMDAAIAFCHKWVARDPVHRYAWVRA